MLRTEKFASDNVDELRRLIRRNPWVTFVSMTSSGLVASHYPTLLDEGDTTDVCLLTHLGRPDEEHHALGASEIMAIVQGPHAYVSSSWYDEGDVIPTWNHVTAHLYGVPEILTDDENFEVLTHLVNHFERGLPLGRTLPQDDPDVRAAARATVGMRLRVSHFEFRPKLSQNKPEHVRENIIRELSGYGPYAHHALADEMRRWGELYPEDLERGRSRAFGRK
ncbi:FMN-binding negative transcriptional regulator [Pseudoclavibacter alba]|uniref:FMN-binding negative transcriptional regulator n=1 Tax=Pseudoclavibacter albus TaxID=272241 RepID=UPI0019D09564|nr:FMN-binding negative transcriptional regulator [Pseudoclavibacter alba]MBN6778423.1 FMN-binding negative transcriptional regulator [Pseudoclavibacter alba]